jgi:hypothetical protein
MNLVAKNVIDLDLERKKRTNPSLSAIRFICALEEILIETPRDKYLLVLKDFIYSMDLGNQPLTAIATACRNNCDILHLVTNILFDITPDVLVYLLETIEKLYPDDKLMITRLKLIAVTFHTRDLSLKKLSDLLDVNGDLYLLRYVLGEDNHFEQYALLSNANILNFPEEVK